MNNPAAGLLNKAKGVWLVTRGVMSVFSHRDMQPNDIEQILSFEFYYRRGTKRSRTRRGAIRF
jgi:hypothetical protein